MKKPTWPNKFRPNATARIAYGYIPSEDDPLVLVADTNLTPLIEEAFLYLDQGNSLRQTAEWLSQKTERTISHQGLSKIWKEHRTGNAQTERVKALKQAQKKRKPKTKEEKNKLAEKKKLQQARRRLTMLQNKMNSEQKEKTFSDGLDYTARPESTQEIVFTPNAGPQTDFLAATEQEVLFGGSAGGGKTYSLIADPMRYFTNSNFNGLILRRTSDELREIIFKTQELYPKIFKGCRWQERKSQWTFPSGARLWLTYLDRDEDVTRYQGQAFSYVAFDELTQYATSFAWNYLRSRLRTTDPTLPVFMRATTNPGGVGHGWVKKTWIDPAPPNTRFAATDLETGEILRFPEGHEKEGQPLFYRKFIPAKLSDNPYLMADGQYEANLLSLPEQQRRQLLDGDWSVTEGAAFSEFRILDHVVEPFEIPNDWRRFRSCDYGYSTFSCVHWFAVDPAFETLYVYRELYVTKNTGRDLAKAVLEAEEGEQIQYGVLDSSCWHNRGTLGPSIAEEMINQGCRWRPSDRSAGSRVSGKNRLHELLKVDPETEKAGIIFFNNCRQIIADLPTLPSCPKGTDDIDVRTKNDHSYDSIRYGIQSRPRSMSIFEEMELQSVDNYQPSDHLFGY